MMSGNLSSGAAPAVTLMVTVTVAGAESASPSFATYWNVTTRLSPAFMSAEKPGAPSMVTDTQQDPRGEISIRSPETTAPTGLRLLNPGSPTDRRRQPFCTYMTAVVDDGALCDVTLHRVERRGA